MPSPDGWRGQRSGRNDQTVIGWRFIALILACCVVIALVAIVPRAFGRDVGQWGDVDQNLRQWYEALMQPDIPTASCCGEADAYFCDDHRVSAGKAVCTITDDRPDEPRGRPHIDIGTVIEIPPNKLKWDKGNPTGRGVIFLSRNRYVFCYVQPEGA